MGPGEQDAAKCDDVPLDGDERDHYLDDLRTPLTVIHASAQLLQRRILLGRTLEPDQLLARLTAVERAAWTIEARLRQLERADG